MSMFVRELVARYWQMVLPMVGGGVVAVLLPGDVHPAARIGLVAVMAIILASLRLHQDRVALRRTQFKHLHNRLTTAARDFGHFLTDQGLQGRDVSVFQAAAELEAQNRPELLEWHERMVNARLFLSWWHHHLMKRLELDGIESRYTAARLRQAIHEVAQLAAAYEYPADAFKRVCERPSIILPKSAIEKFNNLVSEYDLWIQQFRTLRSDAAEQLPGKLEQRFLKPLTQMSVPPEIDGERAPRSR